MSVLRFALLLVLVACSTARVPPVTMGSPDLPVEINVEESCEGLDSSHEFVVQGAERDGDDLLVQVSHAGGCGPHAYMACWTDEVFASDPPSFELRLFHDGLEDMCEAIDGAVLRIAIQRDLEPSSLRETSVILQ